MQNKKNKILKIKSHGWSMRPLIKDGCFVEVVVSDQNKYYLGDIIVFLMEKKLIAHRIIGYKKDFFVKGDNNNKPDGFISKKNIIGKVTKIYCKDYSLNLNRLKHRLLKYMFVCYSYVNLHSEKIYFLKDVSKLRFLKSFFFNLIRD